MRLQEIMSSPVSTVSSEASAEAAWETMKTERIHHLVVLERGQVVGVVTDRDLGASRGKSVRRGKTVADLMSKAPLIAENTMTVRQAANKCRGRAIGCLPVVKQGKLVGIVTVSDLLEVLARGVDRPATPTRPDLTRRHPRQRRNKDLRLQA